MKNSALGVTALAAVLMLAACAKEAPAPAAAPAVAEAGSDAAQSGGDKVKPMTDPAAGTTTDQTTAPAPEPEQK